MDEDSPIGLKSICQLLTGKDGKQRDYWIRAYQRGYRWTPRQVTQLLNDIHDFAQNPEGGSFYCLQPLVVKLADGRIEVVDGQQRLTTIHIILNCMKTMASKLAPTFFKLSFETREGKDRPSLDTIELGRQMENIDYYHICQAYLAVQQWCADHSPSEQESLLQHLLDKHTSGRCVKVIWFELGRHDPPVDAFTRLNVGKIRLTNDELIRALFLGRHRHGQDADDSLKTEIAYEWDMVEKALQGADFWAFLTDEEWEHNRIGFLFKQLADDIPTEAADDEYKVFYSFQIKLSKPRTTLKKEWLEVKAEFMRLQEWFEDERRITYHIIGFLVTQGVELGEIRALSEECTKSQFERRLRDRVYQCIMGASSVPPEPELRKRLKDRLGAWEYGRDSGKIRAVLLLFNIATLLENKKSNMRFQFAAFKDPKLGWDLEHIRSVATPSIADKPKWLKGALSFLKTETKPEAAALVKTIQDFLSPGKTTTEEQFTTLHCTILEYCGEKDNHEERNGIENLTLLDSRTNRSYKNDPFAMKRQTILSLDKAGTFVPLCTRNVFLKCYSEHTGDPIFWKDEDGEAYEKAILETLTGFFLGTEVAR